MIERILQLMEQNGITASKLSAEAGLPASAITEWKKGKARPSIEALKKISEYFNVSIDYLVGNKAGKTPAIKDWPAPTENIATPHIIAYIDLLGTKAYLKKDENSFTAMIGNFYRILSKLAKGDGDKLPGFDIRIFSDNIVISKEYNESEFIKDIHALMCLMAMSQYDALTDMNILLRGGITIGNLYINSNFIMGNGLVEAYELESKSAIYPRIILSDAVIEKIKKSEESIDKHHSLKFIVKDNDLEYVLDFLACFSVREIIKCMDLLSGLAEKSADKKVLQKISWLINFCNIKLSSYSAAYEQAAAGGAISYGTPSQPGEEDTLH